MPETILGAPVNVMKLAGRVALAEIVGGAVEGAVAPLLAEANRLQAFRDELDAELCEATKQLPHTVDEETWRISTCTERILLSVQWMKEIRDSSNPQMLADALELVDVKAKIHDLCEWIHKQHNGTLRKFINGPYDITHLQLLAWAIAGLRTKPSPSAPPAAEVGGESDGMTLCDALAIARYKTCAIKHATWPEGCYAYHGVDNQLYICNPASTSRDLPLSMAVATLLDRQWMIDQWHPYHGHRHFAKAPSSPSQPPVTDKGTGEQGRDEKAMDIAKAKAFLIRVGNTRGSCVISSNDCSTLEIATAQACGRFYVDPDTAYGYVLREAQPTHKAPTHQ